MTKEFKTLKCVVQENDYRILHTLFINGQDITYPKLIDYVNIEHSSFINWDLDDGINTKIHFEIDNNNHLAVVQQNICKYPISLTIDIKSRSILAIQQYEEYIKDPHLYKEYHDSIVAVRSALTASDLTVAIFRQWDIDLLGDATCQGIKINHKKIKINFENFVNKMVIIHSSSGQAQKMSLYSIDNLFQLIRDNLHYIFTKEHQKNISDHQRNLRGDFDVYTNMKYGLELLRLTELGLENFKIIFQNCCNGRDSLIVQFDHEINLTEFKKFIEIQGYVAKVQPDIFYKLNDLHSLGDFCLQDPEFRKITFYIGDYRDLHSIAGTDTSYSQIWSYQGYYNHDY